MRHIAWPVPVLLSLSLACPCSWCTVSPSLMYHRRRISSAVQPQYSAEKLHFVVSAVPGIVFTPFRKATHEKLCCSCFLLMPNAYGRRKDIIERLDRIEHTICKLKLAEKSDEKCSVCSVSLCSAFNLVAEKPHHSHPQAN